MIRKGTYVLFLHFDSDLTVDVGSLGTVFLDPGDYCYVGSAMGGLDQRVGRHFSKNKKIRWHIDRLTIVCEEMSAFESYPDFIPECDLSSLIRSSGGIVAVKGFGCSDCSCETHLYKIDIERVKHTLSDAGLSLYK